jgi:hypothetical protein
VAGLPNKSTVRRSPYRVEHVVNFQGRYFYEKKQASAKELKAAGIVALVPFDDDLVMSHRQRSKHGIKEIF